MNIIMLMHDIETVIKENLPRIVALRDNRVIKSDLSFVTEGDLLINQLIDQIVCKNDPAIVIVSEEANKHVLNPEGDIVVIDPIDGTENFTSGMPEWGISISCFSHGRHIGSMLACPEMNLWMKTGDIIKFNFSRIRGLSSSLNMDELIKATQGHEYRILGCCVYNMINVIRGSFLSFENPKGAHSWDILGGLNLALENNLKVTVNGNAYTGEYLPADQKYKFRIEH
jgi:myo-inositol-1(or 4)-monophosphatase